MLAAHLCRCTGWQGIADTAVEVLVAVATMLHNRTDAAQQKDPGTDERPALPDPAAAAVRAQLEGGTGQRIDRSIVAAGAGGFATDTVPDDALVAVPDGAGVGLSRRHSPPPGKWRVGSRVGGAPSASIRRWRYPKVFGMPQSGHLLGRTRVPGDRRLLV
ncbi:MAG: hypothetical protein R2789_05450 [Microthrixaceae bacterium]